MADMMKPDNLAILASSGKRMQVVTVSILGMSYDPTA